MPTYDYKCRKCGHRFEGEARMASPCPACPRADCGGTTEKTFGPVPAHFRGGGWAKDGYSSTGPKPLTVNQHLERSK